MCRAWLRACIGLVSGSHGAYIGLVYGASPQQTDHLGVRSRCVGEGRYTGALRRTRMRPLTGMVQQLGPISAHGSVHAGLVSASSGSTPPPSTSHLRWKRKPPGGKKRWWKLKPLRWKINPLRRKIKPLRWKVKPLRWNLNLGPPRWNKNLEVEKQPPLGGRNGPCINRPLVSKPVPGTIGVGRGVLQKMQEGVQ